MEPEKRDIHYYAEQLKQQGYHSICFVMPVYSVGGGSWEFCEIAKYLSGETDLNMYYMDYEGGYPSSLLQNSKVRILQYKDEELYFPLEEKCVMITNSTRAILLKKMNPANKIVLWHYETLPPGWQSLFLMGETTRFLQLCADTKAMLFHDWSAHDTLENTTGICFDRNYFKLYLPPKKLSAQGKGLINENELHVVCLGRLGHEKVQAVRKVITLFAAYPTEKRKFLHIIGDGLFRNQTEQFCKNYDKELKIEFSGTIPKSELDQYLIDNADVVFAMGLSALEGAALHIPSVVVPVSGKSISGNWFNFVFQAKEYCMGIAPEQKARYPVAFSTLKDIFDLLSIAGGKEKIGEKCYEYYYNNFSSIEQLCLDLLGNILASSLTMEKLSNCIKYIPYNHLKVRKQKILKWQTKAVPIWEE